MTPKRIRDLRARLGMSQAVLAQSLRLSEMMIYYWKRGTHDPTHWNKRVFEKLDELSKGAASHKKILKVLGESAAATSEDLAIRILSTMFQLKEN